jgi:HTH-type transcriptional regulator, competence development regulator
MPKTLGQVLKEARDGRKLSLREVEQLTGIQNGHLSQIETDAMTKPEMAVLWQLASLYRLKYERLLRLAGYGAGQETSGRQRQRMTVALRAMDELSPKEQNEALNFMAELRARRTEARQEG